MIILVRGVVSVDELVDRLITKCIVAEQLEIETDSPVTCKELLPILEEFKLLKKRCADLQVQLGEL